ncbi:sulfate transporter family-domain-containing protein [Polychytrium aggregatum]|uniref:sulfate transporter family-domain-containing protein n=1 Tax=Polychytrium aggregatum TaxID=110093 RepID=UPI0022FE84BA|nr:sulfate transporter family-domain-containing protein [Polychytrium aggregatum]KAI9203212.1 sulfate transporter family-domain-containing protein [Polychytrium aggregatum]
MSSTRSLTGPPVASPLRDHQSNSGHPVPVESVQLGLFLFPSLAPLAPSHSPLIVTRSPPHIAMAKFDHTEIYEFSRQSSDFFRHFDKVSIEYVKSLFPIRTWITRYNFQWFIGDLITGLTVGFMILPQALAQAKIATLPPEYGLYSAFIGLLVYGFFATTKDITIGPTAVLSLLTAQILVTANKDANGNDLFPPTTFAITLAFVVGIAQLLTGLLRLGVVVDFIPPTVITGFTTGFAFTVIVQQTPTLLGIKGIDTNTQPAQNIIVNIVQKIGTTQFDIAWGAPALVLILLLLILKNKFGQKHRVFHYIGLARNGIVLSICLLISYLLSVYIPSAAKSYTVVGTIPAGFKTPTTPRLDLPILQRVWQPAISVFIVALVEHVGIARSFGRKFGYIRYVNSSQELIAVGLTNTIGSFMSAYPAMGSFSRSAIKAASGVKTPAAGFITSAIVALGLLYLTPVMYWIPSSALSAIIIAAMSDLISPPHVFIEYYNVSILDLSVCMIALFTTFFSTVETGVYVSASIATLISLLKIARPRHTLFGRSKSDATVLDVRDISSTVSPGIFILHMDESLTYLNAQYTVNQFLSELTAKTQYGSRKRGPADRLWCDDTEEQSARREIKTPYLEELPRLRAVIFIFSGVNHIDSAGYQALLDLRRDLSVYTGRIVVFHFVGVKDHIRRVLEQVVKTPFDAADVKNWANVEDEKVLQSVMPERISSINLFHPTLNRAILIADTLSPPTPVMTQSAPANFPPSPLHLSPTNSVNERNTRRTPSERSLTSYAAQSLA